MYFGNGFRPYLPIVRRSDRWWNRLDLPGVETTRDETPTIMGKEVLFSVLVLPKIYNTCCDYWKTNYYGGDGSGVIKVYSDPLVFVFSWLVIVFPPGSNYTLSPAMPNRHTLFTDMTSYITFIRRVCVFFLPHPLTYSAQLLFHFRVTQPARTVAPRPCSAVGTSAAGTRKFPPRGGGQVSNFRE